MKIVVIGGSGLIGSQVVAILEQEHDVVSASWQTGVDTVTGAGVTQALEGADVAIDLSNSPSFTEKGNLAWTTWIQPDAKGRCYLPDLAADQP